MADLVTFLCASGNPRALWDVVVQGTAGIYQVHFAIKIGSIGRMHPVIYLVVLPGSSEDWGPGRECC